MGYKTVPRYLLILLMLFFTISDVFPRETINWPQFRGEGARGIAEGDKLPVVWSSTENVRWRVSIPGRGWSSPIVWQDKVFLGSFFLYFSPSERLGMSQVCQRWRNS